MSYARFLSEHWQTGPEVQRYLQAETHGYFGVGTDATSALDAWAGGLPGFTGMALGEGPDPRNSPSGRHLMLGQDEYIYHFPDGNAGLARALVRALIPAALPNGAQPGARRSMEDLADAVLDPQALDTPQAPVRLRLRATVLGLRHLGAPASAEQVEVSYRDGEGRLRRVRAKQVLLACWHRVIARLTDELPAAQRTALDDQVKVPLLYGNVLLNNWRAFARAGLHGIRPVDGFWGEASLDFPVRMGRIAPPDNPDEPVLLHLAKVVVPGNGQPARAQAAQGRAALLGWRFEDLEGETRRMLQGALGAFGFDHPRDIEALTINRWAHGYAYEYMRPWDRFWPRGPLPCEQARKGWGRVAIANADAGAFAYAHSAVDQATRAVQELLPQARLPAWHRGVGPPMRPQG
jgi:spermidine dehydrogenase